MADLPLAEAELVQMRHTVDEYLPGTAVIHPATRTADGQGGQTWAYAAASTVDARLAPHEGDETLLASRLAERQPYTLTVPKGTTIDEDDRVVYSGVTYEIISRRSDVEAPWNLCIRATVARID